MSFKKKLLKGAFSLAKGTMHVSTLGTTFIAEKGIKSLKRKLDNNKIEKYFYYENKRWDILFFNGLTLKLPSKNIEKSVIIYKQLFYNDSLVNKKIVDLSPHLKEQIQTFERCHLNMF